MAEKKATAKKATETKAAAAKKTTTVKKAAGFQGRRCISGTRSSW